MTRLLLLPDSLGLSVWDALSDERTGLTFTVAACCHQSTHSLVPVLQDSLPHLLSQIWESLILDDQVPVFISPRNRVAQLYSHALGYQFQHMSNKASRLLFSTNRTENAVPYTCFSWTSQKTPFLCCIERSFLSNGLFFLHNNGWSSSCLLSGRCLSPGVYATILCQSFEMQSPLFEF
jgi:hypothetical protein